MFNKRGQELSTGTIILLILGVIVLVLLVVGFTSGWDKLLPFISSSNVDAIKTQCSTACAVEGDYDYCKSPRTLVPSKGADKLVGVTCYYLSQHFSTYGIESCNLDCGASIAPVSWAETGLTDPTKKFTASEVTEALKKLCANNANSYSGKYLQVFVDADKDNTKTQRLISYACPAKN